MNRYRTIVADPPWPMPWATGNTRVNGRGKRYTNVRAKHLPYTTMSIDAIAEMPVASWAADDAHLYLWAPDRFVIDGSASRVAIAWGFQPLRFIVWEKPQIGMGFFPRPQHELLLVCRRGRLNFAIRDVGSVQHWPLTYVKSRGSAGRRHSAKPEAAYTLIERASPGPFLELFARSPRLGWDVWGDEAPNPVGLSA